MTDDEMKLLTWLDQPYVKILYRKAIHDQELRGRLLRDHYPFLVMLKAVNDNALDLAYAEPGQRKAA